jgi:hypothetical protein
VTPIARPATAVRRFAAVANVPAFTELEINPLVAGPDGVIAVDARARVA